MAASTDKRLILRFQFVAWTRLNIQRFFFMVTEKTLKYIRCLSILFSL